MAQFVAFDNKVEVNGQIILATIAGAGEGIHQLLASKGISRVDPQQWYPQQVWLDVLYDISTGVGGSRGPIFDLVSIGMQIPLHARWPDGVDSVETALISINEAYHMNHRNGEIGYYRAERVADKHIIVEAGNPYPSDFDYGIVYGLAKRFLPHGTYFKVVRADRPSRLYGDDHCVYHVIWD